MDEFLKEIYTEVFKQWILLQKKENIELSLSDNKETITIKNKYSESTICFYKMCIVEFTVRNVYKDEIEFYLHFQIKNMKHAIELFNEMLASINQLKNKPPLKVVLSCTGGLTTGYFASRINEVIKLLNMDIIVDAVSYTNLYKVGQEYDMILLAPQISFMYAKTCEILKNQIVLKIPPAIFAKYDVKQLLSFIEEERTSKKVSISNDYKPLKAKDMKNFGVKTLCLALIRNSKRIHIVYRLYDEKNNSLLSNEIIKPTLTIQNYYDVIDSVLVLYPEIERIGICTPGIIHDGWIRSKGINGLQEINIEHVFTSKYKQKFSFCNDANTITLGYYSLQDNCSSLSFIFQPVATFSGMGHIVNNRLIEGYHHVAGEVQYLPLAYSKNVLDLHLTPEGALEAMAKTIVAAIGFIDPQVIVICCFLITNIDELKSEIEKYIPKEYIPEIVLIDYLQEYILLGTLLLCHQE